MSLKHLRTLIAVADHQTFTRAADHICLTHAAVSQHMRALEAEMGVSLFDRARRTPVLNATGLALVARARQLVRDYDNLIPTIQGQATLKGDFTLGVVPTMVSTLAPLGINALKAACPDLRLFLRPGLTHPLLTALERHQIDGAIVTEPARLPPWLDSRPLACEPLMLIASAQVAGDDPLELLRNRPFIRFNRDAVVGAQIAGWIEAQGVEVSEAMELETLDAIAAMVHADIGVSIVPRPCVMPQNPLDLRWLDLAYPAPSRRLVLAARSDSPKAPVIDAVHDAFKGAIEG